MATVAAAAKADVEKKTEDKAKTQQSATEESVEVETTVTVTQPKKTISTSVEIERKLLPDGTVEETKTTTTNTIVNGKVEDSKVKKETRILSDEEAKEVIQEESEEEEEVIEEQQENSEKNKSVVKVNGHHEVNLNSANTNTTSSHATKTSTETKSTTSSETKSTTTASEESKTKEVVEEDETEEEEEEEVEEEEEDEVIEETVAKSEQNKKVSNETKSTNLSKNEEIVSTRTITTQNEKNELSVQQREQNIKESHVDKKQSGKSTTETEEVVEITTHESEEEEEVEEEEVEEEEEEETKEQQVKQNEKANGNEISAVQTQIQKERNQAGNTKTEISDTSIEEIEINSGKQKEKIVNETNETTVEETKVNPAEQSFEIHVQKSVTDKQTVQKKTSFPENINEPLISSSTPDTQTTSKKETTEILSSEIPIGRPISTQTELHRIENIITINKTSKILDNAYEQMTQQGIPTVKNYFAPSREKVPTSPQPAKTYTPNFPITPEKKEERRHSLLLERLSMERQFAAPENYHSTLTQIPNQNYENTPNQWQEPQSEVVVASNVKPSSLKTTSQWYQNSQQQTQYNQQSNNVIYNNVKPTTPVNSATPAPQPSWPQPTYDSVPHSAPIYQQTEQPAYTKPSNWGSNNLGNLDRIPSISSQSNHYSFLGNEKSKENYANQFTSNSQQSTATNQYSHFLNQDIASTNNASTGYVPPPWETETNSYQPSPFYEPQTAPVTGSNAQPLWKSAAPQPAPKKSTPLAYIPPAPNASFVKQASPGPKPPSAPGLKTYYSEYERRYISVPESTYIPPETKVQPQWDASPQYYYDNAEPSENIEPSWRKELREFTEKSTKEESTVVQPPWNNEASYLKESNTYCSNLPSWNQTLRPRSLRETSYESESIQQSQEWPRAQNKRPLSGYTRNRIVSPNVERTRGVSVDRFNSSSYQSPNAYSSLYQNSTHTPSSNNNYSFSWETQEKVMTTNGNTETQTVTSEHKTYHNPQVPAYHARNNESRDYQVSYSPRWSGQGRERPVQSRSFKYLQMLTGTEDGDEEPEPFVVQQPHHAVPKPRRV